MSLRKKIKEKVSDFLELIIDDTSDGIPSFSDQMATLSINMPMTPSVGYNYMPNPMMNQPTLYNYSVAPCRYIVPAMEGYMPTMKETTSQNGFEAFMDDRELQRGDPISEVIMEAIKLSKLSIIVFSENFANSTWCLNDLVQILEWKRKRNHLVWPIFYKVDPTDVRHQKNSYGQARKKVWKRFEKGKEMEISFDSF